MNHLGILLKCKFCFDESRVMLPADADGSRIMQSSEVDGTNNASDKVFVLSIVRHKLQC